MEKLKTLLNKLFGYLSKLFEDNKSEFIVYILKLIIEADNQDKTGHEKFDWVKEQIKTDSRAIIVEKIENLKTFELDKLIQDNVVVVKNMGDVQKDNIIKR